MIFLNTVKNTNILAKNILTYQKITRTKILQRGKIAQNWGNVALCAKNMTPRASFPAFAEFLHFPMIPLNYWNTGVSKKIDCKLAESKTLRGPVFCRNFIICAFYNYTLFND